MPSVLRIALPALAAAGSAYAACSVSATTTIQNSGDASAFASCKTFSGNIAIKTDAPGPIALDGIQTLKGNLVVNNNSAIQEISANSLTTIDGDFALSDCSALNKLTFPELKSVKAIRWIGLPLLRNTGFTKQVEEAETIDIQNTDLVNLEGINIEQVKTMFIANNKFIDSIDMQLGNISESLTLLANNPGVKVTFPNLMWAYNMTFRNCSSVEVPSLETLNNSLNLIGNTFESFSAPNLTDVGGAVAIVSNFELKNISFPLLTEVGDNLQVANNTKLSQVDGFPKLETIKGALDFNGNMSKIELPSIDNIQGAFNIQSTGDVQGTCDDFFQPLHDKSKIQGDFVCVGSVENPGGEGSDPGNKIDGDKKKGAASALNVQASAVLAGAGLLAAFFM
jgi:hypothetical protein